uniref:Uncharacterized protein n=1 Tax=Romanomermis culicivorax TaxID=13658 RepID=A0A915L7R6_ROMCU
MTHRKKDKETVIRAIHIDVYRVIKNIELSPSLYELAQKIGFMPIKRTLKAYLNFARGQLHEEKHCSCCRGGLAICTNVNCAFPCAIVQCTNCNCAFCKCTALVFSFIIERAMDTPCPIRIMVQMNNAHLQMSHLLIAHMTMADVCWLNGVTTTLPLVEGAEYLTHTLDDTTHADVYYFMWFKRDGTPNSNLVTLINQLLKKEPATNADLGVYICN